MCIAGANGSRRRSEREREIWVSELGRCRTVHVEPSGKRKCGRENSLLLVLGLDRFIGGSCSADDLSASEPFSRSHFQTATDRQSATHHATEKARTNRQMTRDVCTSSSNSNSPWSLTHSLSSPSCLSFPFSAHLATAHLHSLGRTNSSEAKSRRCSFHFHFHFHTTPALALSSTNGTGRATP